MNTFNWDRDPKDQGSFEIPLTNRAWVKVQEPDTNSGWRTVAVHQNCTLREVLALVRNKVLADRVPRMVTDSLGYSELVR